MIYLVSGTTGWEAAEEMNYDEALLCICLQTYEDYMIEKRRKVQQSRA